KGLTQGSAVARAGYDGLRRNALYALGAQRKQEARAVMETLLADPSDEVRDAAAWARKRLGGGRARPPSPTPRPKLPQRARCGRASVSAPRRFLGTLSPTL